MTTFTGSAGNDTLPPPGSNNSGSDYLYGLAGDDTLYGGAGADRLDGGSGADRMYGGTGDDSYRVGNSGDLVSEGEFSGGGYDVVWSTISYSLRLNIEALYLSGAANLNGTGNGLNNDIIGNDGANSLTGLGGQDYLEGGAGNDVLQGGPGGDNLVGGTGLDTASYSASLGGVGVGLVGTFATSYDALGDELNGIENLTGSRFQDHLIGDDGANILSGGSGDDRLDGHAGADRLNGGPGSDGVEYFNSPTAVNVNLLTGVGSGGHAEGDVLTGVEGIYGSSYNDVISGNDAANILYGNVGNDIIIGNGGADDIYDYNGSNTYKYLRTSDSNATSGFDSVQDSDSDDRFDLSAIDANTTITGNQTFTFASDPGDAVVGQVTYDAGDGWVYAETNGVAGWDLVIDTAANLALRGSDFIL